MFDLLLLTCTLLRGLANCKMLKIQDVLAFLRKNEIVNMHCKKKVGGSTITLRKIAADIHIDKSV